MTKRLTPLVKVYDEISPSYSGNYAFFLAMQNIGIDVSIRDMENLSPFIVPARAESILKRGGVPKVKVLPVNYPRDVDRWLEKGHKLIAYVSNGDFSTASRYPYEVELDHGNEKRFVTIIEDLGDRWKFQNSQGYEWGDGGFGYIRKDDFKYLNAIKRVMPF